MKRYFIVLMILTILMGVFSVDILGRSIKDIQARMTGQVDYRINVVKGIVANKNINGTYGCYIAGETVIYPTIPTFSREPKLEIGNKVTIEFINGNRETPVILAPEDIRERSDTTLPIVGDLIICCFETHKIWRCKGISNEIIDTITNITNPAGLTIANGNLISASYPYISVHDGFSETLLDQFAPPYFYINGLAFDGTNLISCDWSKKLIYIHNGLSASILSSFASPFTFPRGLTIINGNLISGDANSDMIYIHDGITSTILSSFASPRPQPNGLATDGNNLISGDNGSYGVEDDIIYIHIGVTSVISRSFNAPVGCRRVNGLAFLR